MVMEIQVPGKRHYFYRRRQGILRYRGYDIAELVENRNF